MKLFFLALLLSSCHTPEKTDWRTNPPDGPDTPNHFDPKEGWKF